MPLMDATTYLRNDRFLAALQVVGLVACTCFTVVAHECSSVGYFFTEQLPCAGMISPTWSYVWICVYYFFVARMSDSLYANEAMAMAAVRAVPGKGK